MTITAAADFVAALGEYHLLDPPRLEKVQSALERRPADPRAVAKQLLKQGWLTAYQAELLLEGRGAELVLGEYLLLERLGEGGMGQVFKARHRLMNRTVALKVIRKERLADPSAVQRFHREILLAAQLNHPHVVRAQYAAQVGDTHFLVMEYAEGADLQRLTQEHGPLAVPQACLYISQAALGLHHACELGLVHRDIKPSNLLVTDQGTSVKILDMGLARSQVPDGQPQPEAELTQTRMILGTPDYMAPDQIDDPRRVDIRADIYSLGCTLYFILAGRPPFAGRSWEEKLTCHRKAEPQPIEELRPDVPASLGAVLRKMMAKRPEDRYATPATVADALQPFCQGQVLPTTVSHAPAPGSASPVDRPAAPPEAGCSLAPASTACSPAATPTQGGLGKPPAGPTELIPAHGSPIPSVLRPAKRFWLPVAAGTALLAIVIVPILLWPKAGETGKRTDDQKAKATHAGNADADKAAEQPIKPLLDENFRTAYENKEALPVGWKGEKYRVGIEQGETCLELSDAQTIRNFAEFKNAEIPWVKVPPFILSGNFFIAGRYFLLNNQAVKPFRQTLAIRLESSKGYALAVVTFFHDGHASINDTPYNPPSNLKQKNPGLRHFKITREGKKLTVLIDDNPAGEKTLPEVATYDTVSIGMTSFAPGGRRSAQAADVHGQPRLFKMTIDNLPEKTTAQDHE